jgi:hypothetical protein
MTDHDDIAIAANDVLRYLVDAIDPTLWDENDPPTTTTHALQKRALELHAEVERLRAQGQTVLEPQPGRRYEAVDERCNHIVDVIEWDDGGATIICLTCGAEAAGPTPDHALAAIHHTEAT